MNYKACSFLHSLLSVCVTVFCVSGALADHLPYNYTGNPYVDPPVLGTVMAWGDNSFGQTAVPAGLSGVKEISAGAGHSVALKSDGTVVAWGNNDYGQTTVPANLSGVVAISAGGIHDVIGDFGGNNSGHTVALKGDSTVVAWGMNWHGQATVPAGLGGVTAIAAGGLHTLALKWDGTVVAWGNNDWGQATVPAGLSNVVAIAAGNLHSLALKEDGTVVMWGYDLINNGAPEGLSGVVAIAAGGYHSLALKGDFPVVAWGPGYGGLDDEICYHFPDCWQFDISQAVAAGGIFNMALKYDGTVLEWDSSGPRTIPDGVSQVVKIAAGGMHSLALVKEDAEAPSVPTGLTAAAVSGSSIELSWDASTDNIGVTKYYVYVNGNYWPYSYTTGTTFSLTNLQALTTYSFAVEACDISRNCSARSVSVSATTLAPDLIVPSIPAGLIATAAGPSQIDLIWGASTDNIGVTRYKVYRNGVQVGSVIGTSFSDTGLDALTSYSYTVSACDAVGNCSTQSEAATATTLGYLTPSVPTGLYVVSISAKQNNLSWMASFPSQSVAKYIIYRSVNCPPGAGCIALAPYVIATLSGSPPATSYVDISSTDIFASSYSVQACNALGNCSAPSPLVAPTVYDIMPPTVPAGLTATVVSATQVNLSWAASTDNYMVGGYRVYRNGVLIASPTSRSYSDTGLASGNTYSYTVAACDWKGNCSAQSAAVSATTPDIIPPIVPAGLTAGAFSATQINLNWTATTDNVGVTSYTVYRNGVPLVSGNVTSYSDTGLTALASYSYTVLACDAAGNCSTQSAAVTATTLEGVPPTVPTKLMTSAFSTTQINLTWRASTDNVGVTGYKVYRNGVQVGAPSGTSYSDTGLTAATSYKYTVAACDAAVNCSAQSAAVTGITKRK